MERKQTVLEKVWNQRVSGKKLAAELVAEGVVQREAVDDAENYDGGKTLDAIYRVAEGLIL